MRSKSFVIVNPLDTTGSQSQKVRKKAAKWTDEETAVLLNFLAQELPKAGDGGTFKKPTWTAAASLLVTDFQEFKGGTKDAEACERRFALVSFFLLLYRSITNYLLDEEAVRSHRHT